MYTQQLYRAAPAPARESVGNAASRIMARTQFQTMEGWQAGQDDTFDQYVSEKRLEEGFEAFDQRVERAYQAALRVHRAEIYNATKRRLKESRKPYDHDTMRQTEAAVRQRGSWLRDVFAQIDADYRSGDAERKLIASQEVTKALQGEPGDYMRFVLERKRDARSLGPKGRAIHDAEFSAANMPEVSDEEVNRYASLRVSMSALEQVIRQRFGQAGDEHWDMLQQEKDSEYLAKMERAGEKYKELIEQQAAYDEDVETQHTRQLAERITKARIKFKAAMEVEERREQLVAAHKAMEDERFMASKARYRAQLAQAATWRAEGMSTADIESRLKSQTLERHVTEYNQHGSQEQQVVLGRKKRFLDIITAMEEAIEYRDGANQIATATAGGDEESAPSPPSTQRAESRSTSTLIADAQKLAQLRGDTSAAMTKKALWDVLNEDKWTDPFRTIHQARLDAKATNDELYSFHKPWSLRLGRKANRGTGDFLAGGGNEHKQLNDPWEEGYTFNWGVSNSAWVHNSDGTGKTQYFHDDMRFHVVDPETGDVDQSRERKLGMGATFQGDLLYRMGIDAERDHPRNHPMKPPPSSSSS